MTASRSILSLISLALATGAFAQARLDGALQAIARNPALQAQVIPASAGSKPNMVPALLRFEGKGLDAARANGVTVRSVLGDIASVDIPRNKLLQVAKLPGVMFIEAARKLSPKLDSSVAATKANTLRSGTGFSLTGATGKGVIVGIVDDGIDYRHLDFRKQDGSTRLLQLWDMRASGASGAPPSGFTYGGICTAAMINAAIQGNSTMCRQPSSGGHGTHVASIAAGNGQATGGNMAAFRMVGMAPEADIVSANAIGSGVAASNAVVDAVSYIKQVASQAGKPAVVNLSLGSYFGARDGTSNYERALSNAVDAGFMIVGAAGNEGDAKIRASGNISQGETVTVGYEVPDGSQTYYLEMWYPGTQSFSVRVTGPGGLDCDSGLIAVNQSIDKETSCGQIVVASTDTLASNDDRQIYITLNPSVSDVTVGKWGISLTANSLGGAPGRFSLIGGEDASGGTFTDHTDNITSEIITDTASATNVLGVAAYVTKRSWKAIDGSTYNVPDDVVGDITGFSSRGPRRDCSNLAKCPAIMKPEITAPGATIFAALAQDDTDTSESNTDPDGKHVGKSGTSMATPHVAGAIALLLQKKPNLTLAEVKQALLGHVQTNGFVGTLPVYNAQTLLPQSPNYTWGYGILDVAAAYNAISFGPTFSLARTANATEVSYNATIQPGSADLGKTVNIYIGVQVGSNLFLRNGSNWELYAPPAIPVAGTAVANTSIPVHIATIPVGVNNDLLGSQIYVGYGNSVDEMLNGKVAMPGFVQ
ncbi:S8 family serine peptidase [Chitinimonas sp. JJ19]|uniref:S8 family serine peptidase n=1 Tax=Chitinimonas sp. JJ19 TaxID=3109352 RepID=UPI00300111BE